MEFNIVHNPADVVRGDAARQRQILHTSHAVDIYCHKHPDKVVGWGCVEPDCEDMVMCNECNRQRSTHQQQHKDQIVEFHTFLDIIAAEISKVNRIDSKLYNQNIKRVLENEHQLDQDFEKQCMNQIKSFVQEIDDQVGKILTGFNKIKLVVQSFYEKQISQYKNNILYFKSQYKQLNPEETSQRYGDPTIIASKLLMKTPHQCYVFLRNLRKSANMEGQLIADLDYLSSKLLKISMEKEYLIPQFVISNVREFVADMIVTSRQTILDHLKDIHSLDNVSDINIAVVNNPLKCRVTKLYVLCSPELFDQLKNYQFKAVGQVQTYHTNSVSALVALSDDIVATSSYDRTIKIWRLSTGQLIRALFDKNCISSLICFKFNNDKNPQADQYTDDDTTRINTFLIENPNKKISDSGLLLVSGGFDKEVKVWDFNLVPQAQAPAQGNANQELSRQESRNKHISFSYLAQQSISNNLSQPYQLSEFPIKSLQGHVSWITSLCSLEDEKNVVSGDDTGELIIWNIINGVIHQRLPYVKNPCLVPFINLTFPFNTLCTSSSTVLRVYKLYYQNSMQQSDDLNAKERLSRRFQHNKEQPIQFSRSLESMQLQREVDVGWTIHACLSPYNYRDRGLLIVIGGMPRKIKYVQLDRGRQIEIQGEWNCYIGSILILEKFKYISYLDLLPVASENRRWNNSIKTLT